MWENRKSGSEGGGLCPPTPIRIQMLTLRIRPSLTYRIKRLSSQQFPAWQRVIGNLFTDGS